MLGLILSFLITAQAGPKLKKVISSGETGTYPVIIYMKETLNDEDIVPLLKNKSRELRRKILIQKMKEFARNSQQGVMSYLHSKGIKDIKQIWVTNAIYAHLDIDIIKELLQRDDIEGIEIDEPQKAILKDTKKGKKISIKSLPPAADTAWGVKYINASAAWQEGNKGNGVVVGVFDTGVNYKHNDIKDRIWKNLAEYYGIPGVDDDGNGYVDDYIGWDFANWDNDPMDDYRDMWGNPVFHGSHVAGTIAGDGKSGILTGVAPEAQIMPLKVLNSAGYGAEGWVWLAIDYGIEMGCDVMSFSIGWMNDWTLDRSRWRYAAKMARLAGVVMSCAAGNNGNDNPNENIPNPGSSPPPWLHPDQIATSNIGSLSAVITVGAIDKNGNMAYFSSVGPSHWENVDPWNDFPLPEGLIDPDISAPGVDVPSIAGETNDGYRNMSGTSMATPHMSGVLALLLSKNPELSPRMIDSIVETTADDILSPGKDNNSGSGIVNVASAISAVPLPTYHLIVIKDSVYDGNNGIIEPGEIIQYFLKVKNAGTSTLYSVEGYLGTFNTYITITSNYASAGDIAPNTEIWIGPFEFTASNDVPRETKAGLYCEFYANSGNYYTKRNSVVLLNPYSPTDVVGPDDYGYYAYESSDSDPNAPSYLWVNPPAWAQAHTFSDDSAAVVNLPFTFKYYNMPLDYVVIGNNGHLIVAANSSFSPYEPLPLPYHDAYPMIAPLWTDLDPSGAGGIGQVYSWYDTTNNRFIVTWDDLQHSTYAGGPAGVYEKFQVILYDPAHYPTPTGDGEIVFQYFRSPADPDQYYVPWEVGSVIGIESPYENTGITAWYGQPRPGFHQISAFSAIKFTTVPPSTALSVKDKENTKPKFMFVPVLNKKEILLVIPGREKGVLSIYNITGRKIKTLRKGTFSGTVRLKIPEELSSGIYFLKLETDKKKETRKVVITK